MMPTAGRLAGGLAFAAFGWLLATFTAQYFRLGSTPGYWLPMGAFVGLLVGWIVVGSRAGAGILSGISNAVTGTIVMVLWMLFLVAFVSMIDRSMKRAYDGLGQALTDVPTLFLDFGRLFIHSEVFIFLLVGTLIAGLITEIFGRLFP